MSQTDARHIKGFTLIELMVVITIIGLLASTVLAALSSSRTAARDVARVQAVKELQKALELYRNANGGNYPCADGPICLASTATAGNAGTQVNVNGTTKTFTPPNNFDTIIRPYLKPVNENVAFAPGISPSLSITQGSISYRVGRNGAAFIKDSYFILLRRERVVTLPSGFVLPSGEWCGIRVGTNFNTTWDTTYPVSRNCF